MSDIDEVRGLLAGGENWVKGTYDNGLGGHCLVGAAMRVTKYDLPWVSHDETLRRHAAYNDLLLKLVKAVRLKLDRLPENFTLTPIGCDGAVVNYNDDPATTWDDVDDILKRAAEL